MENKLNLTNMINSDEVKVFKPLIIASIVIVYIAAMLFRSPFQNPYKASLGAELIFTILMLALLLLFLFSNTIFRNKYWLYFGIQGLIILGCAVTFPKGYHAIFFGLIPILIGQSIGAYYESIKVIMTSVYFYSIFCGAIIVLDGWNALIHSIPILLLITIAVRIYSIIMIQQVKLRIHTQKVLQELEFAYEKVEELTLTNERQRMARDLHDTLTQGLAGIIMQLDAVNANLNNNNTKRAQEIVQKSMEHARKTLSDSRLVINDLRLPANADMDLAKVVENEIANFKGLSNTSITANIMIKSQLPLNLFKQILYIVKEALNNIAKHAKAKKAVIEIIETHNQININIIDDGIGFDVQRIDHLYGHYGLLGITERVEAIHGRIKIESKRKSGTNLTIIIPIERGISEENE